MKTKIDFNDILIKPSITSCIGSRMTINPFFNGFLPLIASPMDTVVGGSNDALYKEAKINVCLPRGEELSGSFISFSLLEIRHKMNEKSLNQNGMYLIDIANGHMKGLVETVKEIKEYYPNLTLMVGNIANPKTFKILSNAGADYIRVGIGNGGSCFLEGTKIITSSGDKNIEDVIIGDKVLTHKGEFNTVYGTMSYPTDENLIKINDNTCTENHEFYVLNKKYENEVSDDNIHILGEWIKAKDLTDDYFLLENVDNV